MGFSDSINALFRRPLKRTGPWVPRTLYAHDGSPYDLDMGERITRPKTGIEKWPYPPIIGCVSGLFPMQTALIFQQATAIPIAGPNAVLGDYQNVQNQVTVPGLNKTGS